MIKVQFKRDLSGLTRLEKQVPINVRAAVNDAALALRDDIINSISGPPVSSPGNPPATRSGNLIGSVKIDSTGRDLRGRFTSDKDAVMTYVRIDTTDGPKYHGRGAYEAALEYGTDDGKLEARPFVQPAAERAEAMFPHFFANIFKVGYSGGLDMEESE